MPKYQVACSVVQIDSKNRAERIVLPFIGNTAADVLEFLAVAAKHGTLVLMVRDDVTGRFKPRPGESRGSAGWYIHGKVDIPDASGR